MDLKILTADVTLCSKEVLDVLRRRIEDGWEIWWDAHDCG
jgi:hypothetical protein